MIYMTLHWVTPRGGGARYSGSGSDNDSGK